MRSALSVSQREVLRAAGDSFGVEHIAKRVHCSPWQVVDELRALGQWTWDRVLRAMAEDLSPIEWAVRIGCSESMVAELIRQSNQKPHREYA